MKDIVIYNKDTYDVVAIIPDIEERERDIIVKKPYYIEYIEPNSTLFKYNEENGSIKLFRRDNIIYFVKQNKKSKG